MPASGAHVVGMTPLTTGYLAPASISRPRGSLRIDVYSPKLQRRLQCFSEAIYYQCLCLKADLTVLAYCERPLYRTIENEKCLADFGQRKLIANGSCPVMTEAHVMLYQADRL
jgi:hypothetical protein